MVATSKTVIRQLERSRRRGKQYSHHETTGTIAKTSPSTTQFNELTKSKVEQLTSRHSRAYAGSSPDPMDTEKTITSGNSSTNPGLTDIHWHTHPSSGIFSAGDIYSAASNMKPSIVRSRGRTTMLVPTDLTTEALKATPSASLIEGHGLIEFKDAFQITDYERRTWGMAGIPSEKFSYKEGIQTAEQWAVHYADTLSSNKKGPQSASLNYAYGKLTLAHKLGMAVYQFDAEQEAFIKIDLSTKEARLEAAQNMTGESNSKSQKSK